MAKLYRKRPVTIEAEVFTGENGFEINDWIRSFDPPGTVYAQVIYWTNDKFPIYTLEGAVTASPGDYIIRGIQGEFYPCKPEIFLATYESVL